MRQAQRVLKRSKPVAIAFHPDVLSRPADASVPWTSKPRTFAAAKSPPFRGVPARRARSAFSSTSREPNPIRHPRAHDALSEMLTRRRLVSNGRTRLNDNPTLRIFSFGGQRRCQGPVEGVSKTTSSHACFDAALLTHLGRSMRPLWPSPTCVTRRPQAGAFRHAWRKNTASCAATSLRARGDLDAPALGDGERPDGVPAPAPQPRESRARPGRGVARSSSTAHARLVRPTQWLDYVHGVQGQAGRRARPSQNIRCSPRTMAPMGGGFGPCRRRPRAVPQNIRFTGTAAGVCSAARWRMRRTWIFASSS